MELEELAEGPYPEDQTTFASQAAGTVEASCENLCDLSEDVYKDVYEDAFEI